MRITIGPGIEIDERTLVFTHERSAGPGGQNVNKVNTRVPLPFDLFGCETLTPEQKARIASACRNRITGEGLLQITSQQHRSQTANRRATLERLAELIAQALRPRKIRRATRPGRGAVQRRLASKKLKSQRKTGRSWRPGSDE